jgi:N-acetylneuraminate synthase
VIEIAGRPFGAGAGSLIVAEVAQAHDGSLGMAHAYLDAVAQAGADAVKFQTHIAAAESTDAEPFRVALGGQDRNRFDYWRRMEFSEEQWQGLARHARERGLLFLSSPFSMEAVALLARVGVPAFKVPSGEITNLPLLDRIADEGRPVLLSTGMSPLAQVDAAVARVRARHLPLVVMQCTSAYPCPPEKVGLNLIPALRERYGCEVGLSDHTGTIFSGLAAATLGIAVLEVHVTLSREMYGPDVAASVTTAELRQLVQGVRFVERMAAHPVDKDALAAEMEPLRRIFFKSVVAAEDLAAGVTLERRHLALKKPGQGLPPERLEALLGRRLRRAVRRDQALAEPDLED